MNDLISRQDAIDALNQKKIYRPLDSDRYVISDCLNTIVNLPSAQPERKKGNWIGQKGGGCCCSECGRYALDEAEGNLVHISVKSNFCPNCGADMRGDSNEA